MSTITSLLLLLQATHRVTHLNLTSGVSAVHALPYRRSAAGRPVQMPAAPTPWLRKAATWSCMRAMRGETTMVRPGSRTPGS